MPWTQENGTEQKHGSIYHHDEGGDMTQCHFIEEKMPDSVGMKAYLGMIAECCSFISVTVTSPVAKTNNSGKVSYG